MAKVLIIGATGETGTRLVKALADAGHDPLGLFRKKEQAHILQKLGATPIPGDLAAEDQSYLADAMVGVDAVVFTAGANGGGDEMTDRIDLMGVVHASAAAKQANVQRFVLVSAFPDAWRDRHMPPDFEHYMFVKRQADVHLSHTDLDWVIVRPGTLTNSDGSGKVRVGLAIPYGDVTRDNLALTIATLIDTPAVNRVILELTDGVSAPSDALKPFTVQT